MLVEVKVERLTLDRTTQSPVVVLREDQGERGLPIWIGASEASAIHMQLAHMTVSRPLTHDLLVSAIQGMGATLIRAIIDRVEQNTYFARLELDVDGRTVNLDARPSDSIAVALRTGSPIFADVSLLDMVAVEIADAEEGTVASADPFKPHTAPFPPPKKTPRPPAGEGGMSPSQLQEYLRNLNPEDFGRFDP